MLDHIVVPLDGSLLAECTLPHAVALAKALDARVTLLRVLDPIQISYEGTSVDPLTWQLERAEATSYLEARVARLQEVGIQAGYALAEGVAAEQVLVYAREHNVGLILLSSHGRSGLSGWNISSVVQKILLRAYMPVMIVRAYRPGPQQLDGLRYKNLLVPLDGSPRAECVLPIAEMIARYHQSTLFLAHVACTPEMPRRAPLTDMEIQMSEWVMRRNQEEGEYYLKEVQERIDAKTETRLLLGGQVAARLHELVENLEIDLVLMSAHGYSGATRWPYGSVALNFIAYGTTPLLIVQDLPEEEIERSAAERMAREQTGH